MSAFGPGYNQQQSRQSLGPKPGTPSKDRNDQNYSFPMLKGNEILQCMHELGIRLSEEELTTPEKFKPEIRRAFTNLIELCTGITRDEMCQPAFVGLSALNYPELHEDSIPELAFLRACCKMMSICGIHDFGLGDVTRPNAKRLRRQLSGVINFAKFREERLQVYGELNAQREGVLDNLRRIQEERSSLEGQHAALARQMKQENAKVESVEEECRLIEADIGKLNKQQAALRQETGDLKKTGNELKDKNATLALAIQESYAEEKKFASQIVQSPERVKREMSDATARLEQEKKDALQLERDAGKMRACAANAANQAKTLGKVVSSLEEVEAELEKQIRCMEEIKEERSSIAVSREKQAEVEARSQDAERGIHKFEDKVAHLRKQAALKTSAAQNALCASQTDLMHVEKSRREGMAKIAGMENELKSVEALIEREEEQTEREVEDMINQYKKMESVVLAHEKRIMSALAGC